MCRANLTLYRERHEMKARIRQATSQGFACVWEKNMLDNPGDKRWIVWRDKATYENQKWFARTFVVLRDDGPIGEGTLIFMACSVPKRNRSFDKNISKLRFFLFSIRNGHSGNRPVLSIDDCCKTCPVKDLKLHQESERTALFPNAYFKVLA